LSIKYLPSSIRDRDLMIGQLQYKVFSIPYIIDVNGIESKITPQMEVAAVYCLALCRRRRIGAIIGKIEELRALSKIYYPLIVAPWMERCIFIDGLGLSHFTFKSRRAPDLSGFIEALRRSMGSLSSFTESLNMGARLLHEHLAAAIEKRIDYLICDVSLAALLSPFISKEIVRGSTAVEIPLIPIRVSISDIGRVGKGLSEEWRRLRIEVSMLEYTLKTLREEFDYHLKRLSRESEEALWDYKRRLAEAEVEVERKVKEMLKLRDREVDEITRVYDRRMKALLREKRKIEGELRRIESLLERNLKGKEGAGGRRKSIFENKIRFYREKAESLRKNLTNLSRMEREIEGRRKNEIEEIGKKYESLVASERERIEVLREARDAKLSKINEVNNKIRVACSEIERVIGQLIEERCSLMETIKGCTLPLRIEEPIVIAVPLYAAKYVSRDKVRLDFYTPAKATSQISASESIGGDLFKLNLESKVGLLLSPILGVMDNVLIKNVIGEIEKNQNLSGSIMGLIEAENILRGEGFMDVLKVGLEGLECEGWINAQEKSLILKSLEED